MNRTLTITGIAGIALLAVTAQADQIQVEITGQVVFNGIGDGALGGVGGGDDAVMSFTLDSDTFVDGIPGDVRSYEIDQTSFTVSFGDAETGLIEMELIDPFPAGETPYFSIVEGFPVSDGFFVSTSTSSPGGVPLAQDPYNANFSVGYVGETLDSLDVMNSLGTYEYDGLTNFGFNLWAIFPDNVVMEIDFLQMTISTVAAECTGDLDDDGVVGPADLATLLGAWGPNPGSPSDLDGDGNVNAADLAMLLGAWGPCP